MKKICVDKNIEYVTEMGVQCPCFVFDQVDVVYKRIVWAKFLNAGQTCVSINYVLYNEKIKDFTNNLISEIKSQYPDPLKTTIYHQL